ncbi:peptide chain release factor N(5)-glutamine methyltransferase [Erysipelothrix inopinata]|uniref:peptide chain release factor N(5)-glutamine methyltransferase n=1 Tax=Erysipelothrix inopinata TaxID=225084 RepID=A0A7G9S057_9FIRM|nr:peptide chain release factor N(5)-glutamine methyltransferase [Erysipelothrix inopinata]QNN61232.1 peptide chain release factor N(5)-glutamine methyltransferase [Erysipelothrix inopinata]
MLIKELMDEGTKTLESHQIYAGFSRVLMLELLREENRDLYLEMSQEASSTLQEAYHEKIALLTQDIPLGYVLGYEWFYGYKMLVDENVLIPRSETEELVGYVLSDIDDYFVNPVVADVACGSGAIGIALAKELDQSVYATDISEGALEVAQKNATLNDVDLKIYQGDMLEPLIDRNIKLDVLVCNPPYIKNTEHIQSSVLTYEPHVALFGGEDGLYFYRRVLENADKVLNEKAMIAFEIGFDIGDAVVELAKHYFKDSKIELRQDMNGLDRMVFVYRGINPQD